MTFDGVNWFGPTRSYLLCSDVSVDTSGVVSGDVSGEVSGVVSGEVSGDSVTKNLIP